MAVEWRRAINWPARFLGSAPLALRVLVVLGVVRVFSHIPLIAEPGQFSTIARDEPYLALLDMFSGGAFARGSVVAVALCSYAGGWVMALAAPLFLPRELVSKRTAAWTTLASLVAGPLYLMALRSSSHTLPLALRICDIASLSAGSALFLWLGEAVVPEFGIAFLVAMNVVAATPGYLAAEFHSAGAILFVVGTLAAGLALQVMIDRSMRRIAMRSWSPRAVGRRIHVPSTGLGISLAPSGPLPLLYALAAFAYMRCGTYVLHESQAGWIRRLVALEDPLTDMHRPVFWLALFVVAVPVMTTYGYAILNPSDLAFQLKISGTVIPGVRIGRRTAEYVFGRWVLIGWLGPTIAMLTIVVPALAYYTPSPDGLWPVLLIAILCASQTQLRVLDRLTALTLTYSNLIHSRIRGHVS